MHNKSNMHNATAFAKKIKKSAPFLSSKLLKDVI